MGAFHFLLPHIFRWNRFVTDVPAPARWGLFAINVFFSTLLVLGGAGSIIRAFSRREYDLVAWSLLVTMTAFWLVNASYQILYPFPVAGLRWILLGFAVSIFLLYALAVVREKAALTSQGM